MKLGVLFSGGKDSSYAMFKASKENEIACLISIFSENEDSYMFHTKNIENVKIQSKKLKIPLLIKKTKGIKEEELIDLKEAVKEAKEKYNIEGIVTGAIASNYQASRVKKICEDLELKSINPLWGYNQLKLLKELVENKFKVKIVKVAADGLEEEKWIGRIIDNKAIEELDRLSKKYGFNIAFEGGEAETIVIGSPMFKTFIKE